MKYKSKDIASFLGAKVAKLWVITYYLPENTECRVGEYRLMYVTERDFGRIVIKPINSEFSFEFGFKAIPEKPIYQPVAISRIEIATLVQYVLCQDLLPHKFYLRNYKTLPSSDDEFRLSFDWNLNGKLITLGVHSTKERYRASFYESSSRWKLDEPGEGSTPPPLSLSLDLPKTLKGEDSILGVNIPWQLPEIDEVIDSLIKGIDFDEFVEVVRNNPVAPFSSTGQTTIELVPGEYPDGPQCATATRADAPALSDFDFDSE